MRSSTLPEIIDFIFTTVASGLTVLLCTLLLLRDGSGVLQYHDLGLTPTYRDLLTEMVITSDNTATDLMVQKIGGVDAINSWLTSAGVTHTRMVGRNHDYRKKLLTLINPEFA